MGEAPYPSGREQALELAAGPQLLEVLLAGVGLAQDGLLLPGAQLGS